MPPFGHPRLHRAKIKANESVSSGKTTPETGARKNTQPATAALHLPRSANQLRLRFNSAKTKPAAAAPQRRGKAAEGHGNRATSRPHKGTRRQALLHHHRDRLSERRAAYRPRLRSHRHRRHRPLHAARRPRRVLPHRHRRARHQDAADGGQGERDAARTGRAQRAALPGHGEAVQLLQRRLHPHHRGAPSPFLGGDLAAHAGGRRHLSRQICRLVFGARRGLLRRERNPPRRQGRAARPAGHAGRMGRGGELFLQALRLRRPAARSLQARARFRAAAGAHERSRELRPRRPARICRCRARPSTGASRCRQTPSTSCMSGSTR